jgi:hypothetical protein
MTKSESTRQIETWIAEFEDEIKQEAEKTNADSNTGWTGFKKREAAEIKRLKELEAKKAAEENSEEEGHPT